MEYNFIAAITVFFIVYGLLVWDKFERAVVALLGAGALLVTGVLTQHEAIKGVDFNTIGLLVGMMVIVTVCQKTGMFQYLAIKSAKLARGRPWPMLLYLAVITAIVSAFLDNVTTVLLITPITLLITDELKINPYPFLFSQIFASNIGGTATLIGDPPNIMIGSAAGLSFMDFVKNMTPAMIVVFVVTFALLKLIYGKSLKVEKENMERIMQFKEANAIEDRPLLKKCLMVLAIVITAFILQEHIKLEAATIALSGAAVLLLISGENLHDIMGRIEWPTIFFFTGLFVVVHALVYTGVISLLASKVTAATGGNLSTTVYSVLWLSGIASGLVDNIPFVATMIPLINDMAPQLGGDAAITSVWWALSMGACLGGNGTIIGASANVIVAGIAAKSGRPIKFTKFMLIGFPLMLLSLLICHIYIYIRYL